MRLVAMLMSHLALAESELTVVDGGVPPKDFKIAEVHGTPRRRSVQASPKAAAADPGGRSCKALQI